MPLNSIHKVSFVRLLCRLNVYRAARWLPMARRVESRAPSTIYFIVWAALCSSSVQHLHTRLWRAVRVLYEICFISRPCTGVNNAASPFFRSLVADATGHFDALTKMGWLVALEGGRGNSHKCSGFCSALVITRLLIVFRHDVPLFIAVSFFVAYYLSGCWFNLLRLFSIQHVQDVIIICLKIEKF